MNRTIRVIAAIAAVYLVTAFIAWDFNLVNLQPAGRFIFAILSSFAAIIAILWEDLF